jgi:hypothetical protein
MIIIQLIFQEPGGSAEGDSSRFSLQVLQVEPTSDGRTQEGVEFFGDLRFESVFDAPFLAVASASAGGERSLSSHIF